MVASGHFILLLELLAHYHELILLQLDGVAWLVLLVEKHLLVVFVLGLCHGRLLLELLFEVAEEMVLIDNPREARDLALTIIEYYIKLGNVVLAMYAFPIFNTFLVLAVVLLWHIVGAVSVLWLAFADLLVEVRLFGIQVRNPSDQRQRLWYRGVVELLLQGLWQFAANEAHDVGDALAVDVVMLVNRLIMILLIHRLSLEKRIGVIVVQWTIVVRHLCINLSRLNSKHCGLLVHPILLIRGVYGFIRATKKGGVMRHSTRR